MKAEYWSYAKAAQLFHPVSTFPQTSIQCIFFNRQVKPPLTKASIRASNETDAGLQKFWNQTVVTGREMLYTLRTWNQLTNWLEIAHFSYRSPVQCPRSLCFLSNFVAKLTMKKLEWWLVGLSSGEDRMIVAGVVLAWYPVWQTVRQNLS